MVISTREPGLRTKNMEKVVFIKMGSGKRALGKMMLKKVASYSNIIFFIIHIYIYIYIYKYIYIHIYIYNE